MTRPIRAMIAHRLEPGMALDFDPELLGDLALEQMHLQTARRERGMDIATNGRDAKRRRDSRSSAITTYSCTVSSCGAAAPKERPPFVRRHGVKDRLLEIGDGQLGNGAAIDRAAVDEGCQMVLVGHDPVPCGRLLHNITDYYGAVGSMTVIG